MTTHTFDEFYLKILKSSYFVASWSEERRNMLIGEKKEVFVVNSSKAKKATTFVLEEKDAAFNL